MNLGQLLHLKHLHCTHLGVLERRIADGDFLTRPDGSFGHATDIKRVRIMAEEDHGVRTAQTGVFLGEEKEGR
jgi:hypothetical protein